MTIARCRPIAGLVSIALLVLPLGACGGGEGLDVPAFGTVALVNQTDQGMAPQTVTQFFLVPVGQVAPGPNLLTQPADPGAVVILGLFPEGRYNAVAVLAGGLNVNFLDREVVGGQPTNFVIPGN